MECIEAVSYTHLCEICRGIDNGSILDVVEMDAASNNGVDDIRDLRDETAYTPSACLLYTSRAGIFVGEGYF